MDKILDFLKLKHLELSSPEIIALGRITESENNLIDKNTFYYEWNKCIKIIKEGDIERDMYQFSKFLSSNSVDIFPLL